MQTIGPGTIVTGAGTFYRGPVECFKKVYMHGGIRTLYTGLSVMAIRDLPACVVYMSVYEILFARLLKSRYTDDTGMAASVIAGGTAGVASWGVIMPFDVIKSNIQADFNRSKYQGIPDCVRQIYRLGGVMAFFSGFLATSVRAFPVNAVTFLLYSQTLRWLRQDDMSVTLAT